MIERPRVSRSFLVALLLAIPTGIAVAADGPAWKVSEGDVRVICPLTVGGSFEAKSSALEGDVTEMSARPAALGGSLSIDLKSLDTGIELRNDHLRNVYLEVDKGQEFDRAVLTDIRLEGVDWDTFQGKTEFSGTFLLHGTRKTVSGTAEIHRQATGVRVEASFPIELAEFGIAQPRYLGIGVKSRVEARVDLVLSPRPSAGATR